MTGGTAGALSVGCTALDITLPAPLAQGQSGTIGFDLKIVVPSGADRFGHDGAFSFIGNALPVLAIRDGSGWHLDPYTNNGESFYSLAADFQVDPRPPVEPPGAGHRHLGGHPRRLRPYDHHGDRHQGPGLRLGGRARSARSPAPRPPG